MYEYKLRYNDREEAIKDLLNKNVYIYLDSELIYGENILCVVELGKIALDQPKYIEETDSYEETIYVDGYHFDVLSNYEINFLDKEIIVTKPKHKFLEYEDVS